jgi:hypothetical protein
MLTPIVTLKLSPLLFQLGLQLVRRGRLFVMPSEGLPEKLDFFGGLRV